ncbi:hypothetical protein [Microbacterium atlanticum]|uniref:hypothetical protein n=1 Tax=Microbacterium atlanticum TaxID=2782168 RepID=UPI001889481A|nr:hypothetical protein [Microbacterium atlanticum]
MARVRGTRPARWLAIVAIVALALGVGALAVLAYDRATPEAASGSAAPVPTFEFGAKTPTATPTAAPVAREAQRLLSVASERWWRATVGVCGGPAPVIERSDDQGATWADVTPLYRGIAQVQTLDAFSPLDAELVAAVDGCSAEALRTYTGGEFWDPYADVLAASRFIEPLDAGSVHLPGRNVPAPCPTASGLHAAGDVIALLCDDRAWSWSGDEWTQLAPTDASALAIDDTDVIVAHRTDDCTGITLSRESASTCVEDIDPSQPVAISVAGAEVFVWSGDTVTRTPAPPPVE